MTGVVPPATGPRSGSSAVATAAVATSAIRAARSSTCTQPQLCAGSPRAHRRGLFAGVVRGTDAAALSRAAVLDERMLNLIVDDELSLPFVTSHHRVARPGRGR
jgi:hypothetical protein